MTSAFSDALADAATEGLIDLTTLRQTCLAAIAGGGGMVAFTTQAVLNGKSAQQECRLDAAELLTAVNQAIRQNGGDAVSLTYTDFSGLR